MRIIQTERGWGGHFCCCRRCLFRRNTLLELGDLRVVVSTVGNMGNLWDNDGPSQEIGFNRYYETMIFHAQFEDPYWEADVQRQIDVGVPWTIAEPVKPDSDLKANEMHEQNIIAARKWMRRTKGKK